MRTFTLFFCARSVSDHKAISLYILVHSLFAVFWRCQFTRRRSHDYFLENNPLILFEPVTHTKKRGRRGRKEGCVCLALIDTITGEAVRARWRIKVQYIQPKISGKYTMAVWVYPSVITKENDTLDEYTQGMHSRDIVFANL